MKHRENKIKRQHGIIKGLKRYLEDNVASLDFVEGIIPGRSMWAKQKGRTWLYAINT